MIIGIGIDILELDRVAHILERFGEHFIHKVLTPAEIEILPKHRLAFLAGRLAAKEATVKALGTGFSNKITMQNIQIVNAETGKPILNLIGAAANLAQRLEVTQQFVSISHSRNSAVAYVILEK